MELYRGNSYIIKLYQLIKIIAFLRPSKSLRTEGVIFLESIDINVHLYMTSLIELSGGDKLRPHDRKGSAGNPTHKYLRPGKLVLWPSQIA